MNLGFKVESPYLWPFPCSLTSQFEASFKTYQATAGVIVGFISIVLIFRGIIALLSGGGVSRFIEIFKDLIVYIMMIIILPEMLHLLATFVNDVSQAIPVTPFSAKAQEMNDVIHNPSLMSGKTVWTTLMTFSATDYLFAIFDFLPALVWWVASVISNLFISILFGITPVLLFVYLILKLGDPRTLAKSYLTLFMWPILWNSLGYLCIKSIESAALWQSVFLQLILAMTILVFQLFSFLIFAYLIRGSGMGSAVLNSAITAASLGYGATRLLGTNANSSGSNSNRDAKSSKPHSQEVASPMQLSYQPQSSETGLRPSPMGEFSSSYSPWDDIEIRFNPPEFDQKQLGQTRPDEGSNRLSNQNKLGSNYVDHSFTLEGPDVNDATQSYSEQYDVNRGASDKPGNE